MAGGVHLAEDARDLFGGEARGQRLASTAAENETLRSQGPGGTLFLLLRELPLCWS